MRKGQAAHNFKDISGQRFGKLTAVMLDEKREGSKVARWLCECDCGNLASVPGIILRSRKTVSCGCNRSKHIANVSRTHGQSGRPEYKLWKNIRQRCFNPDNAKYADYGGRDITVAEQWSDFTTFLADVGPRPSKQHSLDRIDNDGHYAPGNVRWATAKDQSNNRRKIIRNTDYQRLVKMVAVRASDYLSLGA